MSLDPYEMAKCHYRYDKPKTLFKLDTAEHYRKCLNNRSKSKNEIESILHELLNKAVCLRKSYIRFDNSMSSDDTFIEPLLTATEVYKIVPKLKKLKFKIHIFKIKKDIDYIIIGI